MPRGLKFFAFWAKKKKQFLLHPTEIPEENRQFFPLKFQHKKSIKKGRLEISCIFPRDGIVHFFVQDKIKKKPLSYLLLQAGL